MRGNPATYATDSSEKKLSIKERTIICFEKRSVASGIPVATLMKAVLDQAVANDEWTLEDENKLHERIVKNIQRNEAIKARVKGGK